MLKDDKIKKIHSRRVFDSRGNPSIEVEILTFNDTRGRAIAPSGASKGINEAKEIRDKTNRYDGKDIQKSLDKINNEISKLLLGVSCNDQENFDNIINDYDNTKNKSKIGGNVSIALSLANYLCAANFFNLPLFKYISKENNFKIPNPEIQIFGGGVHTNNLQTFQDFLIYSPSKISIEDFFEKTYRIINQTKKDLIKKKLLFGYGDEGGFWPHNIDHEEICSYICKSIKKCGMELGKEIAISIDVAANQIYKEKSYKLYKKKCSSNQLAEIYRNLNKNYYVNMIEDPFYEKDINSFVKIRKNKSESLEIIGDDLTATNINRLKKMHQKKAIDGIIIKPNQCGTISETINVINFCKNNRLKTIISARSGDTEENYLSHLAVGWDIDMIKVGSFSRSERMSKWNELLRIKELI